MSDADDDRHGLRKYKRHGLGGWAEGWSDQRQGGRSPARRQTEVGDDRRKTGDGRQGVMTARGRGMLGLGMTETLRRWRTWDWRSTARKRKLRINFIFWQLKITSLKKLTYCNWMCNPVEPRNSLFFKATKIIFVLNTPIMHTITFVSWGLFCWVFLQIIIPGCGDSLQFKWIFFQKYSSWKVGHVEK